MADKVKFAVVGCGHIGKRHMEMIERNPEAELVAFCDVLEKEKLNIDLITQTAYSVSDEKKGPLLRNLILSRDMKQVLVFTSSTYKADNVAAKLRKNGINAEAIHSGKSQGGRTEALKQFKNGSIRVLVATDLISRGIDIKFLPFVIKYELPR